MPNDKDKNKMILKDMSVTIKEINDKDRTMVVVGSKEIVDRDKDIVKIDGVNLKNWKKNPVVLLNHDRMGFPVAKGVGKKAWVESNKLMFKIQFATEEEYPLADIAWKLYKGGYMSGWSIGFLPNLEKIEYPEKHKKGALRIFNEVELIELSGTGVPANQEALMASVNKAWEDNVIDGEELNKWIELIEGLETVEKAAEVEEVDIEAVEKAVEEAADTIEDLTSKLEDSNNKIMELELLVKEQKIDEEIDEFDSYLTEIFEEFDPAGSAETVANAEQMDDNWIEEALNILEGDKNNE